MQPYVCVTYAPVDAAAAERMCGMLAEYGFRYRCVKEQAEGSDRARLVTGAAVLVLVTSPAAAADGAAAELLSSDLRRASERRIPALCVSLAASALDDTLCGAGAAVLIPAPPVSAEESVAGGGRDHHAMALFLHRLLVRHLGRHSGCFTPALCATDESGRTVALAVRAHAGDAEAAYALGCAYSYGLGVPALENEAARWIERAAEAGHPDARIRWGELCLAGEGTDPDPDRAFALFTEAAEAGDERGDYHRGLCYLNGRGVIRDPEQAVAHLTLAARRGYPPALYRLGLLCRDGLGTAADPRMAAKCLYLACKRGARPGAADLPCPATPSLYGARPDAPPAAISMRRMRRRHTLIPAFASGGDEAALRCFARSRVSLARRPEDAWLSSLAAPRAAERTELLPDNAFSVADAAVALGELLEHGSREGAMGSACRPALYPVPTRALVWYRYAARRGHTRALCLLGDAYRRGVGAPADPARAVRLYRLAAERGDEVGQFSLAVCCEQGIGTAVDTVEAARRYEQAARVGYAPAQNNLGGCYEHGLGVVQNHAEAVEWYARAASAGQADALCRLGLCYELGRGVRPDPLRARHLYEQAARLGHPYALYCLGLCCEAGAAEGAESASASNGAPRYREAVRLWEASAEGGVPEAAYALALAYAYGRGVRRDIDCAVRYFRMAAEGGHLQASYCMGIAYLEGRGTLRDTARAVACFAIAAELWRDREGRHIRRTGSERLPAAALLPTEAAGAALYLLAHCTLHGIGTAADPTRAAALLREATHLDHVGAFTALGDLYAYGLLTPSAGVAPADEALQYYIAAARSGVTRRDATGRVFDGTLRGETVSDAPTAHRHTSRAAAEWLADSPIHALLTLAARSGRIAAEAEAEGDAGGAELARVQAWRSFAAAAEVGSADALVGMAECAYFGHGTPKNREASLHLLERAATMNGGRIAAALWLGDFRRAGWCGECRLEDADDAYLLALSTPPTDSECGPYTVTARRNARLAADRRARAEVLYRIASFRAMYFADDGTRRETFSYLAEAVLMGHEAALDDLARMYAFETTYIAATGPSGKGKAAPTLRERLSGFTARRRLSKRKPGSPTPRDGRAGRSHHGWLSDYYTALWPEPLPFRFDMRSVAVPSDVPAYARVSVTPAMRASALNYLGDCYYFGRDLRVDKAAAVACYRRVTELPLSLGRGETAPAGVIWAQYSLGWCLLRGDGTARDPRAAVRYLTRASRTHAEACYVLGTCYERGEGVDVPDDREAIKYYRKAERLGYIAAEKKVSQLEERLRDEARARGEERE